MLVGFDDIKLIDGGSNNHDDEDKQSNEPDKKIEVEGIDDDLTQFPLFAFLAVCLVILYMFYKLVLSRKRTTRNNNANQHLRKFFLDNGIKGKINQH